MEFTFKVDTDKLKVSDRDLEKIQNEVLKSIAQVVNENGVNTAAWLRAGGYVEFSSGSSIARPWDVKDFKGLKERLDLINEIKTR